MDAIIAGPWLRQRFHGCGCFDDRPVLDDEIGNMRRRRLSGTVDKTDAHDHGINDMIASPDGLAKGHRIVVCENGRRLGLEHGGNGLTRFENVGSMMRIQIDEVSLRRKT